MSEREPTTAGLDHHRPPILLNGVACLLPKVHSPRTLQYDLARPDRSAQCSGVSGTISPQHVAERTGSRALGASERQVQAFYACDTIFLDISYYGLHVDNMFRCHAHNSATKKSVQQYSVQ